MKSYKNPREYVIATPTSEIKRNRVHITPLPPVTGRTEPETAVTTPESTVPDASPQRRRTPPLNILSRPKRIIKPSLKALENMENLVGTVERKVSCYCVFVIHALCCMR